MAEEGFVTCGLAVVHPWLCDAMGHLTTRHYVAMFDDAAYHLHAALGHDAERAAAERQGWADVRHEIDYRSELAAGALVRIDGRVTALGRSSLASEFCMVESGSGRLSAVMRARTVCFDLAARRARPLPDAVVLGAGRLFGVQREAGQ